MNCHKNNKSGENKKHNPIKHLVMMILCCGLPFILIGILPFINIGVGFKTVIIGVAPFLCPLMMVFMISMMLRGAKNRACCNMNKDANEEQIKIE